MRIAVALCLALTLISGSSRIPNIVHFILTDRGTSHFAWNNYLAVLAAKIQLNPSVIYIHILDGIRPDSIYFDAVAKFVQIRNFTIRDALPDPCPQNIIPNADMHPAHIADFFRLLILIREGGIYLDTDTIALRSFQDILNYDAVFNKGASNQIETCAILGARASPILRLVLNRTAAAFNHASWGGHSTILLTALFLEETVTYDGLLILQPDESCAPVHYTSEARERLFTKMDLDISFAHGLHLWSHISRGYLQSINARSLMEWTTLGYAVRQALGKQGTNELISLMLAESNRKDSGMLKLAEFNVCLTWTPSTEEVIGLPCTVPLERAQRFSVQNLGISIAAKDYRAYLDFSKNYAHDPDSAVPNFRFNATTGFISHQGRCVKVIRKNSTFKIKVVTCKTASRRQKWVYLQK